MLTRLLRPALALSALALVVTGTALAAPAQADGGTSQFPPKLALPTLGLPPLGANDWSCKPSAAHPTPVVLVHGTFGDQKSLLDRISLSIKNNGYCVYSFDYGNRATGAD